MDTPAQRRILDKIEHSVTSPATRDEQRDEIDRLDARIAEKRALYLRCYFAGHDTEAHEWVTEVDRLLDLRCFVMRGGRLTDYLQDQP